MNELIKAAVVNKDQSNLEKSGTTIASLPNSRQQHKTDGLHVLTVGSTHKFPLFVGVRDPI